MEKRPQKKIFPKEEVDFLRDKAIEKVKSKLLPDDRIIKIVLIGSSVKGNFGKYDPPGFRNSLYSDFDFIVFVKDDYKIPQWLNKEPTGRPFQDNKLNLAFRNKRFIDDKYDVEIFFMRETNMNNPEIQTQGEQAGIAMFDASRNKHIVIYQ